jgi:hypothetical protein
MVDKLDREASRAARRIVVRLLTIIFYPPLDIGNLMQPHVGNIQHMLRIGLRQAFFQHLLNCARVTYGVRDTK